MITLLMCLFMVLWSISSVNISKLQELQRSLQQAFIGKVLDGGKSVLAGEPTSVQGVQTARARAQPSDIDTSIVPEQRCSPIVQASAPAENEAAQHEQESLRHVQQQVQRYARAHGFDAEHQHVDRPARARHPAAHRQGAVRHAARPRSSPARSRCSTTSPT